MSRCAVLRRIKAPAGFRSIFTLGIRAGIQGTVASTFLRLAVIALPGLPFIMTEAARSQEWTNDRPFVIGSWNVNAGSRSLSDLVTDLRPMREFFSDVNVLSVQEIVHEDQVAVIADVLGYPHWVISDITPPVSITGRWFASLEMAILSRVPFEAVAEWDPNGRREFGDGHLPVTNDPTFERTAELDVRIDYTERTPARGFVRADLANGLSIYGVHWKSSVGDACNVEDRRHARQREDQARAVVQDSRSLLNQGRTVIVAGDYNIQPAGRVARSGHDVDVDCEPVDRTCDGECGRGFTDGYDDSISILSTMDPTFRLLTGELPETYIREYYPGGAIDHISVAGPLAADFEDGWTVSVDGTMLQGSDHRPVFTVLNGTLTVAREAP